MLSIHIHCHPQSCHLSATTNRN